MSIELLQQSKKWDMDISFEELVKHNSNCKIDEKYNGHWSDNGFCGMCMIMKHPKKDKHSCIVTISEDGFCYDGDIEMEWELTNTEEAIIKMHNFRSEMIKN